MPFDKIVVIGYSYARGGTEAGVFEISPAGRLAYKGTWHLRSNDYYSSRNYASRLIGSKLVFYTPMYLNPWGGEPFAQFLKGLACGEEEFVSEIFVRFEREAGVLEELQQIAMCADLRFGEG